VIVCHCAVVDHRAIDSAVAQGACSVREVLVRTGAGRDCGGCIPAIRERTHAAVLHSEKPDLSSSEVLHAAG
jgi:bacterioferritin-associated ferredoxin